jgi:very-short-patch-repair endonuclease
LHRGPGVFERDHEKDLAYRAAGFDVLRFTRVQVVTDPARVLVILAQALACPKSA